MRLATVAGALLLAVLLLAAGCRRNMSGESGDYSPERSYTFSPRGFAAVQHAHLYDLSSGKPEWIGALDFGEELELDPVEIPGKISPGKSVKYKPRRFNIEGERVLMLIPVLSKGEPCWIDFFHYADENSPVGVVVEPVVDLGNNRLLHRGDLAVFYPDRKNTLHVPFNSTSADNAVNRKQISFEPDDVEAAKLLARARAARNSERASALLRETAERYPASALRSMIMEMLDPESRQSGTATESLVAIFSTAVEGTAVYAEPDFSSSVVQRLEQYENIRTTERTITLGTSRAGSARWYHVSDPATGWIFGLDLEGAD